MRAHAGKVVFLVIFFAVFVLPGAALGQPAGFLQVDTQSAGLLLLPQEWSVVSKDEPAERSAGSDSILNVQQVLYASYGRPGRAPAGSAALQIFSIWRTDSEGNERPLPEDILQACETFVTGLIGARYGNVSKLSGATVETALEDLSVTTYGVALSGAEQSGFRYKCVSLYRGEKRVLALLKYEPEFEEHWRGQFEIILTSWVESLALTPAPAPVMTALPALPALPPVVLPPSLPEPPEKTSSSQSAPLPENLFHGRSGAVAWLALAVFVCAWYFFFKPSARPDADPDTDSNEPAIIPKKSPEETPAEEPIHLTFRLPGAVEREREGESENVKEDADVNANESAGGGFDKVYSLLDQVLQAIEETEPARKTAAPKTLTPVTSERRASDAALPNMAEAADVLDRLKNTLGDVPLLDTMKNEIFNAIELNAEKPSAFRPRDNAAPDRLVLKLCCDTLLNMLKTGRYHIGKGILSGEGEELVTLYARISGILTQKAYITSQEAEKNLELLARCARESG